MKRFFTLTAFLLSLSFAHASAFFQVANFQGGSAGSSRDTTILPQVGQPAALSGEYNVYKRRLDSIKKDVPLDFNGYVQSYIDLFSRNREEMGHVLGLTKYYFPIFEKAFRDAGIPDELKYLSIVESKLNPYAISRVGAAGPWQFMYTTARLYGLNVDEYVDDRRDPIQASYAAAAYLKDAYEEFGDWLLAIASYNCGKSNVEHAIDQAGASDFWSIRQYLPVETRNYVPAYIAVTYVMNYYQKCGIVPEPCDMDLKTDTVMVNKHVSITAVAQALGIDPKEIGVLNPAYKLMIVNGTPQAPRRLVIPQVDRAKYAALYDVLNTPGPVITMPAPSSSGYNDNTPDRHRLRHTRREASTKRSHNYITYKVKRGDTLSGIAAKFDGASVEKLKSLNGLKDSDLQPGMTLRI